MTKAQTKVRATVKIDPTHFLTVDWGWTALRYGFPQLRLHRSNNLGHERLRASDGEAMK